MKAIFANRRSEHNIVKERNQQIGFYGGGFDPVHTAHLILAETALESIPLDKIIFMPSGGVAHYKDESNVASGADRLEMLRLAIGEHDRLVISSYEIDQQRFCYTINTMRYLRDEVYYDAEIFLLAGGDWIDKIPTWKEGEQLMREFPIAIFSRPGFQHKEGVEKNGEREIHYIDMPLMEISSSNLRERRRKGQSIRYRVPEAVYNYIESKGLYLS